MNHSQFGGCVILIVCVVIFVVTVFMEAIPDKKKQKTFNN